MVERWAQTGLYLFPFHFVNSSSYPTAGQSSGLNQGLARKVPGLQNSLHASGLTKASCSKGGLHQQEPNQTSMPLSNKAPKDAELSKFQELETSGRWTFYGRTPHEQVLLIAVDIHKDGKNYYPELLSPMLVPKFGPPDTVGPLRHFFNLAITTFNYFLVFTLFWHSWCCIGFIWWC